MAAKVKKPVATKRQKSARGSIGAQIFEQVDRMVAEQKIGRTEAFRRLSSKSGRRAGTVAANYYRIARQRGAKLAPRRRRRSGRAGVSPKTILGRALAALEEVSGLVRQLESDVARLRRENTRMAAIRKLIGRG